MLAKGFCGFKVPSRKETLSCVFGGIILDTGHYVAEVVVALHGMIISISLPTSILKARIVTVPAK
jgi:hypothetical protein